jgi:hypothetical protein
MVSAVHKRSWRREHAGWSARPVLVMGLLLAAGGIAAQSALAQSVWSPAATTNTPPLGGNGDAAAERPGLGRRRQQRRQRPPSSPELYGSPVSR